MSEDKNELLGLKGNTKTSTQSFKARGRNFLLTLNEIANYESLKKGLMSYSTLLYMIAAQERAPTTGHEHIHIFTHFKQDKTLWSNKLFNVHIDLVDYPDKAIEYVKKDGNILDEVGKMRQRGGVCGLSIKDVKLMSNEELDELPICYYNIVEKIKKERLKLNPKDTFKEVKIIYIYGDSGSGKSYSALHMLEEEGIEAYDPVKYDGKFWTFTSGEGIALYDDFRDSDMKPNEFINFIDYNKHPMRILNGSVMNNYRKIFITSIIPPMELYRNKTEEFKKQWLRRMDIYKIEDKKLIRVDPFHDYYEL